MRLGLLVASPFERLVPTNVGADTVLHPDLFRNIKMPHVCDFEVQVIKVISLSLDYTIQKACTPKYGN